MDARTKWRREAIAQADRTAPKQDKRKIEDLLRLMNAPKDTEK